MIRFRTKVKMTLFIIKIVDLSLAFKQCPRYNKVIRKLCMKKVYNFFIYDASRGSDSMLRYWYRLQIFCT